MDQSSSPRRTADSEGEGDMTGNDSGVVNPRDTSSTGSDSCSSHGIGKKGGGGVGSCVAEVAKKMDPEYVYYTPPQGEDGEVHGLTIDHMRLLYLIGKYSKVAMKREEKEEWIRSNSLLVLIYEGVVSGAFDYDYAPTFQFIGNRHLYFNISREGRDDIDDLRAAGMVNGLKMSTRDFNTITAYQISKEGVKAVASVSQECRDAIHNFIYSPLDGELLTVEWDEDAFYLCSPSGYRRKSDVTDCEDVSYVSSPFLPCGILQEPQSASRLKDNSTHCEECMLEGGTNIRDELTEYIHLENVKVLLGDWIPFGANQIAVLNDKLGAYERIKGGLFTARVDDYPGTTRFSCDTGLTKVDIIESQSCKHLTFQADINYPEDDNIIQIEHFGVHAKHNGSLLFGLKIESVMDRKKQNISVDHMARVVIDVCSDSSCIIDSLLSTYQRSLLDTVFLKNSLNRGKFTIIYADSITPNLPIDQYMDKEAYENELKQILGDLQTVKYLDNNDSKLFLGTQGLLIVSKETSEYDAVLTEFLSIMSKSIFIGAFFTRLFTLQENLDAIHVLIDNYEEDPNSILTIRSKIGRTSRDVIIMSEVLSYLEESLAEEPDDSGLSDRVMAFAEALQTASRIKEIKQRILDMKKNIRGCENVLNYLRDGCNVICETRSFHIQEGTQANTKNLEDVFRSNERASNSLELMQVILAGTLAFEILDRVTGEWSVVEQPWAQDWIVTPLMHKPGVWFLLNMILWAFIGMALIQFMKYLAQLSQGVLSVRLKANMPISVDALNEYLQSKPVSEESYELDGSFSIKKVAWEEECSSKNDIWGGACPKIEITIDEKHGFLLTCFITIDKSATSLRKKDIESIFFKEMKEYGVMAKPQSRKH
eukprot:Nk52_evm5s553 gene=Nk52_evmTU5s553